MKQNLVKSILMLVLLGTFACKQSDDNFNEFAKNNYPTVPVTFSFTGTATNGYPQLVNALGNTPFLVVSLTGGLGTNIPITLNIPSGSGRTITSVIAKAGAATNVGVYATPAASTATTFATTGGYTGLNSRSVTLNFTLTEFGAVYGAARIAAPPTSPYNDVNANTWTQSNIVFQVTLDDGTVIVPTPLVLRVITNN